MPGSTYGEDGQGAETLYMILTWVGIVVMVVVLVAWVLYENRRLIAAVPGIGPVEGGPAAGPPPQPGGMGDSR
jgi:NADH:ubiquinone oxidoreductase subunit H